MLSKLLAQHRRNILAVANRSWKSFIRANTENRDKIIKIGDVCYIPVPCPDGKGPDSKVPEQMFPRIVRGEPGKVRFGFVPEEWFVFFHKKTGISGPYVFLITVPTYLISKELYVMEHEYYSMLSVIILWYLITTRVGPMFAKYLDKEIDEYEKAWNEGRVEQKQIMEESIEHENKQQWSCEGQLMLLEAKRNNVGLQLEATYRKRLQEAHAEVMKRLNYQTSLFYIERRVMHKNLVEWVVNEVLKSYTDDKAKENIDNCIDHLATLATNAKSA